MKNTILRYGIYSAITICSLFLISWFLLDNLSHNIQAVAGYVSMVVSLLFVFFGIKHFRDHENEGIISFGKALVIGVLITLIASVAFGVLDVIYVKYMNPDFLMEYYDQAIETAKNTFSGEELTLKIKEINNEKELFSNPFISFLLMAVTVFMIGFIISLLSALILQRKSTKTSS